MDHLEYKIVPGFSRYLADSNGNLYSRNYKNSGKLKMLKPAETGGYLKTMIQRDNRAYSTKAVHNIVALAFFGERPPGYEVDHINGIKIDNRICNLEYVSHSVNCQRSFDIGIQKPKRGSLNGMAKLTEKDVAEIREYYRKNKGKRGGYGRKALAERYRVSESHIKDIISRRRNVWPHV